jgi:acetylornithine deacetylase/succinyl-diaminopimelate desuccinylase-like protein
MSRRWRVPIAVAIGGSAVVAALVLFNHRASRDENERLFIPKQARITPEIELLRQYVRVDTTNPPGNETAGARFLASLLERNGIRAEIIESAPGRGSVYARIRGRRNGEGLLLLNHIDVVPAPPAGWTKPPFAADVQSNQLYGRGTLDMKGIAICQLEALIALARTHRTPDRDVAFLATADEEQGGRMGVAWLLAHRPDLFEGIRYVLNEGGINETSQERMTYIGIEVGSKMPVSVNLRAATREQLERARLALEPYGSPRDPDRVLPEVREFLRDLAPHRLEQRERLEDIDRTIAEGKFWLLPRGYRELMQNVVWPRGATRDARGPLMSTSLFDLPDENPDARIAWLRSTVAPYGVTVEVLQKNGPVPLTSTHTPMYALIRNVMHAYYADVPVGIEVLAASTNDSRYLRPRGIACYGMWPFEVDFFETQGIHSVDERVRLDWFERGVELMRDLVGRYAFGPLPAAPK